MIQIRPGVFETNSSSTHSYVKCDNKTWSDFVAGKLFYNVLSRYHEEYLEKYPLDKYKWVPEDSSLNDYPIFCTFKQVKEYIYAKHGVLNDAMWDLDEDKEKSKNSVHRVSTQLLFFMETFYSFDELEESSYDKEAEEASLGYYFG